MTAKIIDLGLAKPEAESPSDAAISLPGILRGHRRSPVPSNSRERSWTSVRIFTRLG